MNNTTKTATLDRTRIAVGVTCLLLVLLIGVFALLSIFIGEIETRDDIADAIADSRESGETLDNVTDYAFKWGIRNFKRGKLREVELYFARYYYKSLPKTLELADSTVSLFLDSYYEKINLDDRNAVTDALIHCYLEAVGDPYSYYFTREEYSLFLDDLTGNESFVGIGVYVEMDLKNNTLKVNSVFPESPAAAAGIMSGDYIVSVDGFGIEELGAEALADKISGEEGSEVTLIIRRADEAITCTATRQRLTDKTVFHSIDPSKIGYVLVTQFKESTAEDFRAAIDSLTDSGAVGIIFDMRNNPGGLLDSVVEVIDYIVPDGKRIATYKIGKHPTTTFTSDDGHSVNLPIAVLCNGNTASAGELFCAAMRDYNDAGVLDAVIVGETTYKKGIMQQTFNLSYDGAALKMTVAFYNPPSDVNYDGVGVVPDYEIFNTGSGDSQLDKATEEIKKMINQKGESL